MKAAVLALLFATASLAHAAGPGEGSVESPAPLRRFALVAGANQGGAERVALRYAKSDAAAVGDVLVELGGVARDDLLFLSDPRLAELDAALEVLAARMEAARPVAGRVELLFYYSGHSDEHGLLLGEERLLYRELKERVAALPSDVRIVVLDSCASGALTRLKGGQMRPPFLLDAASEVRGHAFLTSASADEAAQESDRVGGSFFTHYLVTGLRGAADASGDGRVTLSEAYQFAFHETLRRTETTRSGPQHASYDIQLVGTGDLVMTDLRAGDAALLLPDELAGRVYVRGARGHLVAEVDKVAGRGVRLSLPAGEYDVLVEENGRAKGARLALVEGASQPLAAEELRPRAKEPTVARGPAAGALLEREATPVANLDRVAAMKERGFAMVAGGATSAVLGVCCMGIGALGIVIDAGSQRLNTCAFAGGACALLGLASSAFGVPVAWLGANNLSEAEALEGELRPSPPPAPLADDDDAAPDPPLPGFAY